MGGHVSTFIPPGAVQVGDWVVTDFEDGLTQWRWTAPWPARYYIEKVGPPAALERGWTVVDRYPPEKWAVSLYPPVISGPYDDLDAAKAGYVILMASAD